MDFDAFAADKKTTFAVIRALEIVGEATKRIPDAVRQRYPDVPWRPLPSEQTKPGQCLWWRGRMNSKLALHPRAMSWLARIRCGHRDQPERYQERREGRAVEDDMHRIGHNAIAFRQKRMGLAKHRTVARRPVRCRAKDVGDPPRLEFAREEYAIEDGGYPLQPSRKRAISVAQADPQQDCHGQRINERVADETGCGILTTHPCNVIEGWQWKPIMCEQVQNMEGFQSD